MLQQRGEALGSKLFASVVAGLRPAIGVQQQAVTGRQPQPFRTKPGVHHQSQHRTGGRERLDRTIRMPQEGRTMSGIHRSEERRVGKERRSRWSPYHYKKKGYGIRSWRMRRNPEPIRLLYLASLTHY